MTSPFLSVKFFFLWLMTPIDFTIDQNNMRKVIDDQNTYQRQNFKISYFIIT